MSILDEPGEVRLKRMERDLPPSPQLSLLITVGFPSPLFQQPLLKKQAQELLLNSLSGRLCCFSQTAAGAMWMKISLGLQIRKVHSKRKLSRAISECLSEWNEMDA